MSLEMFVKKLKKFLKNRGAGFTSVRIRMYDDFRTNNIEVFYAYNGIKLRSTLHLIGSSETIKEFSVDTFKDIEDNLNRICKVQNMHKGKKI